MKRPSFRFLLVLSLMFVGLVSGGVSTVTADSGLAMDPSMLSPEEQALWNDLLAARAMSGLKPLMLDAGVTAVSRARSTDMAARSYFDHTTPDGKTMLDLLPNYNITYNVIGETIAWNQGFPNSGDEAARTLIASPHHHEILFDSQYTMAGVGHAVDASGKHYFTVIVLS